MLNPLTHRRWGLAISRHQCKLQLGDFKCTYYQGDCIVLEIPEAPETPGRVSLEQVSLLFAGWTTNSILSAANITKLEKIAEPQIAAATKVRSKPALKIRSRGNAKVPSEHPAALRKWARQMGTPFPVTDG